MRSPLVPVAGTSPLPRRRRERILTEIARTFSTVCNPFVTALALFVILAHAFAHDTRSFWYLLFISTFFTSIGPMLFILWLYVTDRIGDLDMSHRNEREAVFGGFVVFYFLGTGVLWYVHAPTLLVATMAGYSLSSLVVQFITRYWKISTHAIGVTAPLVVLGYLYGAQPLPFAILVPIVGWSRVYLKAHTTLQVIAGSALAVASVVFLFRFFHLA